MGIPIVSLIYQDLDTDTDPSHPLEQQAPSSDPGTQIDNDPPQLPSTSDAVEEAPPEIPSAIIPSPPDGLPSTDDYDSSSSSEEYSYSSSSSSSEEYKDQDLSPIEPHRPPRLRKRMII